MDNGLRVRQILFENLLNEPGNRENWEKLCCSDTPLVPFVGAGISAWCYPTWDNLLKDIVEEVYSSQCSEIVQQALSCDEKPNVEHGDKFHWMEEIAECIFEEDAEAYQKYIKEFDLETQEYSKSADLILHKLRSYVGAEGKNKKIEAEDALYEKLSETRIKEKGKIPEYQNLFCKLFQDVLITTNYDKALEKCYTSILSYSYKDLKEDQGSKESWLNKAIIEKLSRKQQKLDGKENIKLSVTVPEMPMLLKVHGSIERVNAIALSWNGYERAYKGEMPKLLENIIGKSTIIFLGCSLRDDRVLDQLKSVKKSNLFAFLPKEENIKDAEQNKILKDCKIHPIYYSKKLLEGIPNNYMEDDNNYHDLFLGLLLENLARRKMFYPKPLETLWDKDRFKESEIIKLNESAKQEWLREGDPQYIHREQALQIWDVLNTAIECPLIAVVGEVGTGKSFLCKSIQQLHKSYKDTMQFFYISMSDCRSWEEFCIRIYEELNIIAMEIPEKMHWKRVAKQVAEWCIGYWRSVLILDHIDGLQGTEENSELWEIIKNVLWYWKENNTRVIFTCENYPKGISCYTWQIKNLQKDEAEKVFFNACQLACNNRNTSRLERETFRFLFSGQTFQSSEVDLLGRYANSKGSLAGFWEEWKLCSRPGDETSQILARMLWKYLLDEHSYAVKAKDEQEEADRKIIEKNILWIWGILGKYPGVFPHVFFDSYFEGNEESNNKDYKNKNLSKKTLRYMKNCGLCEEITDERQDNLLDNMVSCVEKNFISKGQENNLNYQISQYREHGKGMECFRGYYMQDYEKNLREDIIADRNETSGVAFDEEESIDDILELLDELGKKVKENRIRIKNKELNLILHYEIRTIIRLLRTSFIENTSEKQKDRLLNIGKNFSSYYHYMPSHAFPLVKQLIDFMKEDKGDEGRCSLANMYKVQGDIQRLLGKKEDAIKSYEKALELCDNLILSGFRMKDSGLYRKILHIKAGTLLACTYYKTSDEKEIKEKQEEAKKIYVQTKDDLGLAYYYQRVGEMALDRISDSESYNFENFELIKHNYLEALEIYNSNEDFTRKAYVLKCLGDLIVEFKSLGESHILRDEENSVLAIKETNQSGNASVEKWLDIAIKYYYDAFRCYCEYINWRGLANVLQAMGTCNKYRIKNDERVEKLYSLAEECYRWLGDVRGLSDTLDYFGYYYKEKENTVNKYRALNKWKESRKIWEKQGNDKKANKMEQEIKKLEQEIKKLEQETEQKSANNKEQPHSEEALQNEMGKEN